MEGTALTDEAALAAEETGLARAAAAGDRSAFAELYERHEPLAFNLAYRITGSEATAATAVREAFLEVLRLAQLPDHEPPFRSHLLVATRHACLELTDKRSGSSSPGPAIAAAVDPEAPADPQEEVRAASLRLPERQREVLALRELGDLSYEEIAVVVETSRSSVAQLISRARINLSDELHGTVLAAIAAPSPECERALPLIASREDGQLEAGSRDAAWLDSHISSCERCRLGVEAMQEAGASYRSWAPITAAPGLLEETMAKAAELTGAGRGLEMSATTAAARTPVAPPPDARANRKEDRGDHRPRRRVMLVAGLAVLLLLFGVVTVLGGDDPPATSAGPAADNQAVQKAKPRKHRAHSAKAGDAEKGTRKAATTPVDAPTTAETQLAAGGGSASESPTPSQKSSSTAEATVQPTKQASAPKAGSKAKPKPTPAPAPTSEAAAAAPPPSPEEPEKTHGNGRGPQGEPPGHSKK
jgi:RNA polymerase sigma factor (sigma-70 family)